MLVDAKKQLVDNVLSNAVDLLESVQFELSQKDMVRVWRALGILASVQNDRFDSK